MTDLTSLSPEEKLELLHLLETRDRRRRENWLQHYKPYPKQKEFHAQGATHRERLFVAGNQLGKCRTVDSVVEHPDGTTSTIGELWARGEAFEVLAWDGEKAVRAAATHLVAKPAESCVEVQLASGRSFKASLEHLVLTGAGYASLGRLLAFAPCLPACDSARGPSARGAGDPHSSGTPPGFPGCYSTGHRQYDEQLLRGEAVVRELPQPRGGARRRSRASLPSGVPARPSGTSTAQPALVPPSSLGARVRSWVRGAAFLARDAYTRARRKTGTPLALAPWLAVSASLLRSCVAAFPGRWSNDVRALVSPFSDGDQIVAYRQVACQIVYDMTVRGLHNYIADGVVHHNTLSGAAEVAMHVTGLYPDWWTGYRFMRPTRWIVGSESGELTRKGVQRLLLGPPENRNEWGTGAIPKTHLVGHSMRPGVADAVASMTVKNEFGGESVIQFNSYDQGRMQHVDSRVLTPTGWRRIGDLVPGDEVIAGDGTRTTVEGVFPHGVKDLYEFTFDSGVRTLAGAEHLWLFGERTSGSFMVCTTADLVDRYGDQGARVASNKQVSMPNVGVAQLQAREVPVDPYLVGALLGDGCVRGGRIRFTSKDEEIVGHVRAGAARSGAELVHWGGIQYGFKDAGGLRDALDELGMSGRLAHDKVVPDVYLWNEPAVRMAVLQGLLDTDGSVSKKGSLSFSSTSPALVEGVSFLVRSFGGKATVRVSTRGRKRPLYQLALRMPGPPPFRLARKAARCLRPEKETHRHILRSIRKAEPGEAVCIAVAHPSRLYVTDDFIVTHNTKWQADTLDGVWCDEEPPIDLYTEALTRTNATGGMVFVTFTPLLGMSAVVKRFLQEKPEGTSVTSMTIDDVDHYTAEQKAKIIAAYPEHEREARARGIPMMGEGQVFPVAESMIRCDPFEIPPHWARIGGMDFGWSHPAGFVCVAHDRETDTAYVYDAWKVKGKSAIEHAMMIIGKGYQHLPWAWPHDGLQHDKTSGVQLVKQYKSYGVNTLPERAQFPETTEGKPGGNSVEAGVSMMLERMQTRRLRVFSNLEPWFEELRMYHRKEGQIVKVDEDILSATRYALMMLRKARLPMEYDPATRSAHAMFAQPIHSFDILDPLAGY